MKLFIPACGDRIVLTKDWHFNLLTEHRNIKFAEMHDLLTEEDKKKLNAPGSWEYTYGKKMLVKKAMLPADTMLECDRIYIRATSKAAETAAESYDSVTWKMVVNGKARNVERFWVKLRECDNIEYMLPPDYSYRDRKDLPLLVGKTKP